jgi:hypothetical protein
MAITVFSVTTGNPQTINLRTPGGPTIIGVQNDGAGVLTLEGKLGDSTSWAALGTVAAATISGIEMIPGLTSIRVSGTANTGVIVS